MNSRSVAAFLLLFVVAGILHVSGFHIPYYADDFQYVFVEPSQMVFHDFLHASPINTFYRPLQTMVLAIIQSFWGWETFALRILHLIIHATIALLLLRALKFWNIGFTTTLFGVLYFLGAQMNGAAVLGNDTLSQLLSALFSLLTLWLLYRYKGSPTPKRWVYVLSIVTFFVALLSKETSAGLILSVAFLSYILSPKPRRIGAMLREIAPYIICFVVYWTLRSMAGAESPHVDEEQYGFGIGTNLFVNLGLLIIQSVVPVSSLSVARFFHEGQHVLIAGVAILSLLFGTIVIYGLLKSPHRKLIAGLCVLTLFSWVPVILLSRVSEQYAYNSAPFFAALVVIAGQYYWSERRSVLKLVVPVFGIAFLLNVIGIFEKATAMKEQGDRAEVLFNQVVRFASDAPQNGAVCLVHPDEDQFYFSLYRVRGFTVISWSEHLFRYRANRPDLRLYVIDSTDYRTFHTGTAHLALTYDPGTWQVRPL